MSISLIANSGIQFHRFELKIDPNEDVIKSMGFQEYSDDPDSNTTPTLLLSYYLPDQDFWVSKKMLKELSYIDSNNNLLLDNINYNIVNGFASDDSDKDFYTIGDVQDCMETYSSLDGEPDKWLPLPYFKKNTNEQSLFGPISWARFCIKNISKKEDKIKTYKVALAFDTTMDAKTQSTYFVPKKGDTDENDNLFGLCNNEDYILGFCTDETCTWVQNYLTSSFTEAEPTAIPFYKHIAQYVYLMKYLEALNVFTDTKLFSDKQLGIEVDLVVDIGNANTCGVLFESPSDKDKSFNFNSVDKLRLNDLSNIHQYYDEPFSMRLAFVKPKFGDIHILEQKPKSFTWLSIVRLGEEAKRLIGEYTIDPDKGKETATHHSSPKRYLWDNRPSDIPWEFVNLTKDVNESVFYEGVSEQFGPDGVYLDGSNDTGFSIHANYSKKSLMTFVFMEIILNAITQMNSHEFRLKHGNLEKPRVLKRITVTCPTSIIQKEQIILRKAAEEAVQVMGKAFKFLNNSQSEDIDTDHQIIPSPKDLSKKLSMIRERKDWIYDEATCGQFVFLYAEIAERYLNNPEIFFNLYGKKREDVDTATGKALTIGSIDIGGGTTDLMICAYQYEGSLGQSAITPNPLYWESFNIAGDDLLKEIVQQIILEGNNESSAEGNHVGMIKNAAHRAGVTDVAKKMQNFFGVDSNRQGYIARIIRKNFIVQVAIPIALAYLEQAVKNKQETELNYEDIFKNSPPNGQIVEAFNTHFAPLKLEEIKWTVSPTAIFSVLETTFDPMLRQLSAILSAYGCDFILLAGKPTSIPKIREMFIKYYPVSPERIISLDSYRVGRWYPFADDLGYFEDPKTIVCVGAIIALMGGKLDKLDNFTIRTEKLKRKLISTADYIGLLNRHTSNIEEIFIDPDTNRYDIEVHSLPMTIGYKQLPNKRYRGRPIFKLDFNNEALKEKISERDPTLEKLDVLKQVEAYKVNLKSRLPFIVKLKRVPSESKEDIFIDMIKDVTKNEMSRSSLSLSIMTLADENGYWLDTGEFVLNIK
jgi:hypothetical protein